MWFNKSKPAFCVGDTHKSYSRRLLAGIIGITLIAIALLWGVVNPNVMMFEQSHTPLSHFGQNNMSKSPVWNEKPQWEKRRLSRFAQKNMSSWVAELESSHPDSIALVQERMAEIETLLQTLEMSFGNPEERSKAPSIKRKIRDQEQQLLLDIQALLEASPSTVEKLILAQSLTAS